LSDITVQLKRPVTGVRVEPGRPRHHGFNSIGKDPEAGQQFQERSEAVYKLGFEDGKKIGLQEGRDDIKSAMATIKRMVRKLEQMQEELDIDADRTVATLALSIASAVIRKEISVDNTIVRAVAKDAVKLVEDKRHITIRINPADKRIIKEVAPESISVKEFDILEDDSIEPGGCIIDSESGILDAQISVQLQEMAEKLL